MSGTASTKRKGWPYYTATWKRLRAAKLARDPICAFHELRGSTVAATVVDHNVTIARGGLPFPDLDDLTSLCETCHNEKTARIDRGASDLTGRRFAGCGADGNPLDPEDAWNAGGLPCEQPRGRGASITGDCQPETVIPHANTVSFVMDSD